MFKSTKEVGLSARPIGQEVNKAPFAPASRLSEKLTPKKKDISPNVGK